MGSVSISSLVAAVLFAFPLSLPSQQPVPASAGQWEKYIAAAAEAGSNLAEKERLLKFAVQEAEKFGPQDLRLASSLYNLAELYREQGKKAEAEPLYRRSLAIHEKVFGPEHPALAASLDDLVEVYRARGKHSEAVPLYQRLLAIREKALGPKHPDIAELLEDLADTLRASNRQGEAQEFAGRARAIRNELAGRTGAPEESANRQEDEVRSLNNLADAYWRQGKYAEAEPLLRRVLAIREKERGPEHPDVVSSLYTLARLYRAQSKASESRVLERRVVAITEKALGSEDAVVAPDLDTLAEFYRTHFREPQVAADEADAKAEALLHRALALREKALGPEHPDVARSLHNLANLYSDPEWINRRLGKGALPFQQVLAIEEKGVPLLQQALAIEEKVFGPDSANVALTLDELANLYTRPRYLHWFKLVGEEQLYRAKFAEGERLYKRSLAIREKALGPEHLDVATSLDKLGRVNTN